MAKRRSFKKSRRTRRRTKTKVTKKIKKYVQRAIKSHVELKYITESVADTQISTISGAQPQGVSLLPNIVIGTATDQRIGNKIKLRKSIIKGFANLLPYNAITNSTPFPVWVKMWLVSYKPRNTTALNETNISTEFFNAGSTNAGFLGTLRDLHRDINTDNWIVHKTKMFKLGEGTGSNGYADNGSFTKPWSFRFDKYLKSKLIFNDGSNNPSNKNMFLIFQAVNADGTATVSNCEVHYTESHWYEDA